MCARYEMTATPRMIMDRFHLDQAPPISNKDEMRPTDQGLIIDAGGPRLARWGLTVDWSKQPMINARAETLTEKPTFRPLLEKRCLVPMTAYFEWRKFGADKLKNRIWANDNDHAPLCAFAGLTDGDAFTIVTCAPAQTVAHIHGRMPVILTAEGQIGWPDATIGFVEAARYLGPYTGELIAEETQPAPPAQADLFS